MIGITSLSTSTLDKNCCNYNSIEDLTNCMQLSAILLRKSVDKIIFFTDKRGLKLIESFKHLYDEVVVCLDELDWVQAHNWAYSKIYVYQYMKEPFLHIDNDVFLWDRLPSHFYDIEKTDFFFQGKETFEWYSFYKDMIKDNMAILPKIVLPVSHEYAYNCGVAGFNNLSILKLYNDLACEYIKENQRRIIQINQALMFEQWFITKLCEVGKVDFLLHPNLEPIYGTKYTHLPAGSKHHLPNMIQVSKKLEAYKRVFAK